MASRYRAIVSVDAWRYVLIMIVAFATTVVVTRLYLEATGYPQIGNETFHFAHALWGGLLLVLAALVLLIFVNRWIYGLSAVLAGLGVGLFIDEVGKFITQQNDYFFPLAAPIIYVAFLLLLLVYLILSHRSATSLRSDMYQVLRELEEVLEDDLSPSERADLLARLERIRDQKVRRDFSELANHLITFLQSSSITIVPERETWLERLVTRLNQLEKRIFSKTIFRRFLMVLYAVHGLYSGLMLIVLTVLLTGSAQSEFIESIFNEVNVTGVTSLNWYLAMILLHLLSGLLILFGAIAFVIRRDSLAITLGIFSLLITITFANVLSFYFNQFSIVLDTIFSFAVLFGLQRYRDRFLRDDQAPSTATIAAQQTG